MAKLPRDIINNLTYSLNQLSLASRRALRKMLANLEFSDAADLRQKLIEILEPFFSASTDLAATYAAQMYDEIRETLIGERLGAIADSGRNPVATEKAIRAFISELEKGGLDRIIELLCERMDYEIKKAAAESTLRNGLRDPRKPKFARVPTGAETCNFCIMLASRGFVYSSAASAGALDHFHPNCDCRVVPGFGDTHIPGYDPDALYRKWKDSGFNPGPSKSRNKSSYKHAGSNGEPSFKNFNDVKQYLYDSSSHDDLNERIKVLGSIYGYQSNQMNSQSLKNVIKTTMKKLT